MSKPWVAPELTEAVPLASAERWGPRDVLETMKEPEGERIAVGHIIYNLVSHQPPDSASTKSRPRSAKWHGDKECTSHGWGGDTCDTRR